MSTITSHTTRAAGTILTAAVYNADHVNHVTNALALNTDKLEGATPPVGDGHGVLFDGVTGAALKSLGAPSVSSARLVATGTGLAGGGDLTVNRTLTLAVPTNHITNAMLADMATQAIKGRTTAGAGAPEDLTPAQATAILNAFTAALKGLVPASGGGTTNFLRADGNWTSAGVTTTSIVKEGASAPNGFINNVAASIAGTVLTITTTHP